MNHAQCVAASDFFNGLLGLRPEQAHGLRVLADVQQRLGAHVAAGESRSRAFALYGELKMRRWLDQTNDR